MNLSLLNKGNLINKTKLFFRSNRWRNLLVFFTFVVLAFVFWLIRYYQQKFEVEISIPVRYEHIPDNMVPGDSLPDKINLKIQDKGTVVLNYYLAKNRNPIEIDLKEIPRNENVYTVQQTVLTGKIYERLLTGTQLVSFYPENIRIECFPLKKKELPVAMSGNIQLAPGYIYADSLTVNPSTVTIYGNEQAIAAIKVIETKPVKESNADKDINLVLDLEIPPGIRVSPDKVRLTAGVEAYTEKTFELPIVSVNLPENLYVRFFPSSVAVVCQVPLSKYAQLTEKELELHVDYKELKRYKNTSVAPLLGKKPKGLINYRMTPERVEYLIEQKGH